MATKQQALRIAAKYGFQVDEEVTGRFGLCYMATFDHPTHSIAGDCRSIHVETFSSAPALWDEAIERMDDEGSYLERCENPDCEYHHN